MIGLNPYWTLRHDGDHAYNKRKRKYNIKENLEYITSLFKKERSCKFWKFYID
jgi:hypothetical protein